MKSTIIPNTSESEQPLKYPILMEHPHYKCVVLFHSEQAGIIVHEGRKDSGGKPVYYLGFHSPNWISPTNKEFWKPFEGKIELSN